MVIAFRADPRHVDRFALQALDLVGGKDLMVRRCTDGFKKEEPPRFLIARTEFHGVAVLTFCCGLMDHFFSFFNERFKIRAYRSPMPVIRPTLVETNGGCMHTVVETYHFGQKNTIGETLYFVTISLTLNW